LKLEQVAAITSSVRKFMKTPEEIAEGLEKIRDIGYPAVQISGLGEYDAKWMKKTCDDLGLTICATHESNTGIVENPQDIIHKMEILGAKYVGYPYPHTGPFKGWDHVQTVIDGLNHAGAVLKEAGLVLVYHNHNMEFLKFDGRPALAHIYDGTDPAAVQGEPDTHWIQAGGGDVVDWCKRLSGRLPVLHMKDYGVDPEDGKGRLITPIGEGNLNWDAICAAAAEAGCEWYVVEQDGGTFEGLQTSFDYITTNLLD
jgi:sugar phosphate isomerase/epimerase